MFRSGTVSLIVLINLICPAWSQTADDHTDSDLVKSIPFRQASTKIETGNKNTLFEKLSTDLTGIDFVIPIDSQHADKRLYYSAMACGSVAVGDLDGDGLTDLFFTSGPTSNRLYRQTSDLHFEDQTLSCGIAELEPADLWSSGVSFADVDNDGDLDIYVCCYDSPNRLYINQSKPGELRFEEQARERGLDISDASLIASFADYDHDGDLDVFVAANAYYRKGGRPKEGIPMQRSGSTFKVLPPMDRYYKFSLINKGQPRFEEAGRANMLFINKGDGTFENHTAAAGILPHRAYTNSISWWDYNTDGWADLYVANDFNERDLLYRNNQDGTFTEVAGAVLQHTAWSSMGSSAMDLNNDGMPDFIVTDMMPTTHYREKLTMGEMGEKFTDMFRRGQPQQRMTNAAFFNTGTGRMFEAAWLCGIARSDWSWSIKSADFDSDGRMDLFVTNGHSRDFASLKTVTPAMRIGNTHWDFYEKSPEHAEKNLAFHNLADFQFKQSAHSWGLDHDSMSYAAALADLDQDGDIDIITTNLNQAPGIFINRSTDKNSLSVSLRGLANNHFGIGARLHLTDSSGDAYYRTLNPQNGYQGSDEPLLHFGLPKDRTVRSLTITWPSGKQQSLKNLAPGFKYEISEDTRKPATETNLQKDRKSYQWFHNTGILQALKVTETEFNDFYRQALLPAKHSKLGPGLSWGDVNGDNLTDFFIGSPRKVPGRLLLNNGIGANSMPGFLLRQSQAFTQSADSEDMGSLIIDIDGDGDDDLYVVSGGVEDKISTSPYNDHLYLNDGQGHFTQAPPDYLPDTRDSGASVTSADFDRDGDLDLLITGRIIPGKYPLPASSRLLLNNGSGKFSDATESLAPGLLNLGLATGALWSDADNDGWLDLFITIEWGSVKYFHNTQGKLVDHTEASGLAEWTGLWNGISGRDLDGDGDIDYLVTNVGLNTKYTASKSHPELLYYGEFDDSGKTKIIEAGFEGNVCYPHRGYSCSTRAMPGLKEKFGSYESFASATLNRLYTRDHLAKARRFEVNTLETGILYNQGNGKFHFAPLPRLAQISPSFGCVLSDFNADGVSDIVLAQNSFSPQQETGNMDGGLSLLLQGQVSKKNGNSNIHFTPVWPKESGIVIPGDSKSVGTGDINQDGRPDLLFGINNEAPNLLLNTPNDNLSLQIRLQGSKGNHHAIGAKVTVKCPGLPQQTAEIHAGAGYISQSDSSLYFGLGPASKASAFTVTVKWPDGQISHHPYSASKSTDLLIKKP
ncbi:MAG: hypothetical protein GXP30_04600 [Verrucomicrobia bacterium]|nr:hypothetical protein [Verrucomicrobiota bacterium]